MTGSRERMATSGTGRELTEKGQGDMGLDSEGLQEVPLHLVIEAVKL